MSAYGAIPHRPTSGILSSTLWACGRENVSKLSIHHLTLQTARSLLGIVEYLHVVFAEEVEQGMTYPQEGAIDQQAFETYFFAADVFVAVLNAPDPVETSAIDGTVTTRSLEEVSRGREWADCIGGYYYVRYPVEESL